MESTDGLILKTIKAAIRVRLDDGLVERTTVVPIAQNDLERYKAQVARLAVTAYESDGEDYSQDRHSRIESSTQRSQQAVPPAPQKRPRAPSKSQHRSPLSRGGYPEDSEIDHPDQFFAEDFPVPPQPSDSRRRSYSQNRKAATTRTAPAASRRRERSHSSEVSEAPTRHKRSRLAGGTRQGDVGDRRLDESGGSASSSNGDPDSSDGYYD